MTNDDDINECGYCHKTVSALPRTPDVGDDAAWAAIEAEHARGCEWATTRAHRGYLLRDVDQGEDLEFVVGALDVARARAEEWANQWPVEEDHTVWPSVRIVGAGETVTGVVHPAEPRCPSGAHAWGPERTVAATVGVRITTECGHCGLVRSELTRDGINPSTGERMGRSLVYRRA